MIHQIKDLPSEILGIRISERVSEVDYYDFIYPLFTAYAKRVDKLNYMLLLETDVSNFTIGAWVNDAALGLKYITKWNKVAILTDQKTVRMITNIFGKLAPGEYRGYPVSMFPEAIKWMTEKK